MLKLDAIYNLDMILKKKNSHVSFHQFIDVSAVLFRRT